jgi:hypothetical protein
VGTENSNMTRNTVAQPRCAKGANCVAFPTLGEPSKLSRGNPGPRCFACEERRAASQLKRVAAKEKKAVEDGEEVSESRWGKSKRLEEHVGREHAEVGRAYVVLERRRKSVLTCERGLRSALASGDEHLVRRWSRSLRDAKARLAWAEADLEHARTATR